MAFLGGILTAGDMNLSRFCNQAALITDGLRLQSNIIKIQKTMNRYYYWQEYICLILPKFEGLNIELL